jgi:endonuclease-3 related protein
VSRAPRSADLAAYYRALERAYGPQGWWPGRSRFEVIVGAILTQNVAWSNVEKALHALRAAGLLEPTHMASAPAAKIARLIRPSGSYRQKARTLRALLADVEAAAAGDLERYLRLPLRGLRSRLLAVLVIGPETADSILLYAARKRVFVVDAYTRRILARHRLIRGDEPYEEVRLLLESSLPRRLRIYNEGHALLVRVAKEHCHKRRAECPGCPLEAHLPAAGSQPRSVAGLRKDPARRIERIRGSVPRRKSTD